MAGAFGLYTHITANRRRSVVLIAGLFGLVYLMIFAGALAFEAFAGGPSLNVLAARAWQDTVAALPIATIGTGLWVAIAYKGHQWMIDAMTDSHGLSRTEAPALYNLLENLCISRGLPMPKLKVMETGVLNAFASGMNENQYTVTVTRGLIEALNEAELEAVLAHELTHIRNGDVRLMIIAVVIAGVVSFIAEILYRWLAYGPRVRYADEAGDGTRRAGPAGAALVLAGVIVAVAWILSGILRFALSRSREYLADAGAVELTKNPDAMISALMKISGRAEIPGAPSGIMELCIENAHSGFVDLFATHPAIEDRIEALVRHAGGQRPAEPPSVAPSFTGDAVVMLDKRLAPWGPRPPEASR
ncbi:MAG: M48 family metallopeptidase [Proteobacteria bacterium]|nr:M48 family metallopeptidase [Pseudomonadota bacterium]